MNWVRRFVVACLEVMLGAVWILWKLLRLPIDVFDRFVKWVQALLTKWFW